jgi:hypothetical protein
MMRTHKGHRLINLHRLENGCHRLVRFHMQVSYPEKSLEWNRCGPASDQALKLRNCSANPLQIHQVSSERIEEGTLRNV